MTGRYSKCKEMCESECVIDSVDVNGFAMTWHYESNCCGDPLIEDEEQSHTD